MGIRGEWTCRGRNAAFAFEFEYDPNKSASNKEKHGIDFEFAKELWKDKDRYQYPSKFSNEPRYVMIAKHSEKYYAAITTIRNSKIRIISVRCAREKEIADYENAKYDS